MQRLFLSGIFFALTAMVTFSVHAAAVGETAPDFQLPDSNGKQQSLKSFRGKYVVLEWFNEGCPYVKKHYESGSMQKLQKDFAAKGVDWLNIISSAPGKQGHGTAPEVNAKRQAWAISSQATLLDPDGTVGRLYGAKTTPHLFIINPEGKIVYMGAIDDKPSSDQADLATAKNYVSTALAEAMSGKPVAVATTIPYGCSVKY